MRKTAIASFIALTGLLIVSVPTFAHHGAAQFDVGKRSTVKGSVVEWFWANPHCFLRFDAKDEGGQMVHWVVEAQSGPNILPLGFTKQSFKPGDQVRVTFEPVKNGRPLGRLLSVVLADGKTLKTGGN